MSGGWDGNGNFTRSDGVRTGSAVCQEQETAATGLDAELFDYELNTIATALENTWTLTGETVPTANQDMNNKKFTNLAAGAASGESVHYGQLTALVPAGSMTMYGGTTAPSGWLMCDGSAVSRTTYSALFAIISTTFGVGDGSTTFNLPDFRQNFPIGKAASGTGATLGETGGAIDHDHTVSDHTHSVPAHYHSTSGTGTTLATASDGAHTHTVSDPAASSGAFKHFFTSYNGVNGDVAGAGTQGTKYDLSSTAIQTTSNGAHTHTMTGDLGNVSSGVSGDNAMTTGVGGAQTSSTNNPPYLTVNFIIKH